MNADGQVETFVITVATGIFLGLAFDFYRVLRALYRPHWLFTALADLVYCATFASTSSSVNVRVVLIRS
jgi:hypothetical protein